MHQFLRRRLSFVLLFISALILLLGSSCQSLASTISDIPLDRQITRGVLENGLSYYIVENDKPENRAELRLIVNAGSILEDKDQRGLAHFLEHMAFNGTELYPKNDIVSFLQDIGMEFGPDVNAYTSFDETVYMLSVPTNQGNVLNKSFEVLEQWAFYMTLDEQDVIDERGVVLEEFRLRRGAQQRILDQILPVLFKGSLYAERLPIGQEEIIRSADSQTLRRFYDDWYRPDLMAVVAVGDFDSSAVENMIRERFSKHTNPPSPKERTRFEVPILPEEQYVLVSDPEETITSIDILNRHNPEELLARDDYRNILIETLFYSMINQRFFELIQKADPPFIDAQTYPASYTRWTQHSGISVLSEIDGIERALHNVSTEYERLRRYGFLQSELDRARSQELRQYENYWKERNTREHSQYLAAIQENYLTGIPLPSIDWEWEAVQELMPEIILSDFNQLIDERLNDNYSTIIITGPEELEDNLLTQEESFTAYRFARTENIDPWFDTVVSGELVPNPPGAGSIILEEYDEPAGIYRWNLSNGAVVYARPTDFKEDEILFSAVSPGGLSLVDDDVYISGSLAATAVEVSGLGEMTAVDIEKALAGKQVSIAPWISEYEEGLSGSASPEDLETLLQLGYLYFTDLGKDEEAWESYSNRTTAYLENQEREPRVQYRNRLSAVLYNDHLRSRNIQSEDIAKVDFPQALDIFRKRFANAGDFTFFFVGSFEPEQLKSEIERWIASLPGNEEQETPQDRGLNYFTGNIRDELRAGIEPLSIVTMSWNAEISWSYDTLYDISALSSVLDILLIERVREEAGGTYSIYSTFALNNVPDDDYQFIVQFSAEPNRVDELIDIVKKEIARISDEGPESGYVQKVSESQRVNYGENLERNAWWLSQIQFLVTNELGWEYALEKTKWYDALTAEDIRNSARILLGYVNYAEIILFPNEDPDL